MTFASREGCTTVDPLPAQHEPVGKTGLVTGIRLQGLCRHLLRRNLDSVEGLAFVFGGGRGNTVDGQNPANQLIRRLSHHLQGFSTIPRNSNLRKRSIFYNWWFQASTKTLNELKIMSVLGRKNWNRYQIHVYRLTVVVGSLIMSSKLPKKPCLHVYKMSGLPNLAKTHQ